MSSSAVGENHSSGRSSSNSSHRSSSSTTTGSLTSYATLPTRGDYHSEVLLMEHEHERENEGKRAKLAQDARNGSMSLESNATTMGSTLENTCGRRSYSRGSSSCNSSRRGVGDDEEDEDDGYDRDDSMEDNKSSCSDFSATDDCDLTIMDEDSFKRSSSPKNEAELMFLQVVEILRFEKKVKWDTVRSSGYSSAPPLVTKATHLVGGDSSP